MRNECYMERIIFIGGIGGKNIFGGELTKNKIIIEKLKSENFQIVIIDTHRCNHNPFKLIACLLKIVFFYGFSKRSLFIISTSSPNTYKILSIINVIPRNHPIVYWVIGGLFGYKIENKIYKKEKYRKVNKIIVEGSLMEKQLSESGFNNVITIPNFKNFHSLPKSEKYKDGKIHFIFLSRIQPEKGCELIYDCSVKLNENGYKDKYQIDFYGRINDKYINKFHDNLKSNSNLKYCGTINLNVWENYNTITKYHYMLFPTFWHGEGFPGVVIDAGIAGVPLIASNWNFNTEFIKKGKNGYLVNVNDVNSLYEAMEFVIRKEYDYNLVKACQENVINYDINTYNFRKILSPLV